MTLSDLKKAAAVRQSQDEAPAQPSAQPQPPVTPKPVLPATASPKKARAVKATMASDSRTKMLGARVPLAIHREVQQHIVRAQEDYPDLTMQEAVPALIRLLRDEKVWTKFMAELEESE